MLIYLNICHSWLQTLEAEKIKLQASINDGIHAFDEILSKLFERKVKSEMSVYQASTFREDVITSKAWYINLHY